MEYISFAFSSGFFFMTILRIPLKNSDAVVSAVMHLASAGVPLATGRVYCITVLIKPRIIDSE